MNLFDFRKTEMSSGVMSSNISLVYLEKKFMQNNPISLHAVNKADGKRIESNDWLGDWIAANQITFFITERDKAEIGI